MSQPSRDPERDPARPSPLADLPGVAAFAVMGTTIAGCEGAGVALGLWVDHLWHLAPLGLILGVVLGTVAAVVSVISQVRRYL